VIVLALHFTGVVDPTALATFVLAATTLATLLVGLRALRQTQSEIDLSRREVEEAHRPVLVPLHEEGNEEARPRIVGSQMRIAIKNIGSGPALSVELRVRPGNPPTEDDQIAAIAGIGVGDATLMSVETPGFEAVPSFALQIVYTDVARKSWSTSAFFASQLGTSGRFIQLQLASAEDRVRSREAL
jgi:hypothetical protein